VFQPTGDVDADMAEIKRFYAPFKGRNATEFDAGCCAPHWPAPCCCAAG